MKAVRVLILGAILGVSAPIIAWASHGKAGLWEVTVQNDMGGMSGMPDMSKMPPQARARMQAMGMRMDAHGMTVRRCMTQAEVNNDKPDLSRAPNCKTTNVRMSGRTFSADLTCTGTMNATGHVQVTYDSPEHYAGSETVNGTIHGHPVNSTTRFSARWISPNCGNVHN
jgi:hypothetical protein